MCVVQDGRADVVANDAGDRVTPAVVAYRDNEQVQHMFIFFMSVSLQELHDLKVDSCFEHV